MWRLFRKAVSWLIHRELIAWETDMLYREEEEESTQSVSVRKNAFALGLDHIVDRERFRRDPEYYGTVTAIFHILQQERYQYMAIMDDKFEITFSGDIRWVGDKDGSATVKEIHKWLQEGANKTFTTPVTFFDQNFGSGWISVIDIKFIKGVRYGAYKVEEPGPNKRYWYCSKVGPDVFSASTKDDAKWHEYAYNYKNGSVVQTRPEFTGMGNSQDVQRFNIGRMLLEYLAPRIIEIDDMLDSMDVDAKDLESFNLNYFFKEEE